MIPLTNHPWLDMSAQVTNPTAFTTASDGSQYPSTLSATTVACTIQPLSSSEALEHQRLTGKVVHRGYFDPLTSTGVSAAIHKDATLVVTEVGGGTRRYRALGSSWNAAGLGARVVVVCDLEENT